MTRAGTYLGLVLMIGFLSTSIGCRGGRVWPFWARGVAGPHGASAAQVGDPSVDGRTIRADRDRIRVVRLAFDVLRVDLPLKDGRQSLKIWNHVDELRTDPQVMSRLARNGLRMGAASKGSWPAIETIFRSVGAITRRDELLPQRGVPLAIKLGTIGESESIFSYSPEGRLVGKTFSTGDKVITIDYAFRPELGGTTSLQLELEVRVERGVMTWENRGGEIIPVPAIDRHSFPTAQGSLTLRAGEYLVIGAAVSASNEYLLGSRFLSDIRAGERYETILCITPRPYGSRQEAGSASAP